MRKVEQGPSLLALSLPTEEGRPQQAQAQDLRPTSGVNGPAGPRTSTAFGGRTRLAGIPYVHSER